MRSGNWKPNENDKLLTSLRVITSSTQVSKRFCFQAVSDPGQVQNNFAVYRLPSFRSFRQPSVQMYDTGSLRHDQEEIAVMNHGMLG